MFLSPDCLSVDRLVAVSAGREDAKGVQRPSEVKLFFRVVFILHPPRLDWVGFRGLVGDIPYKETERYK